MTQSGHSGSFDTEVTCLHTRSKVITRETEIASVETLISAPYGMFGFPMNLSRLPG